MKGRAISMCQMLLRDQDEDWELFIDALWDGNLVCFLQDKFLGMGGYENLLEVVKNREL